MQVIPEAPIHLYSISLLKYIIFGKGFSKINEHADQMLENGAREELVPEVRRERSTATNVCRDYLTNAPRVAL
jgi:hypothetical protein